MLNLISGNPVFLNDDICKKNKKCMNGTETELRMAKTVTINRSLGMVPGSNECFHWVYSAPKGFTYVNVSESSVSNWHEFYVRQFVIVHLNGSSGNS